MNILIKLVIFAVWAGCILQAKHEMTKDGWPFEYSQDRVKVWILSVVVSGLMLIIIGVVVAAVLCVATADFTK